MTQTHRAFGAIFAICGLTACITPEVTRAPAAPGSAPVVDPIGPLANPATVDASTGTCFERAVTPALIETVTEQIIVPEILNSDGTVITPATFRTETRQDILRERREVEFETPCNALMTPQFVASVQRALIARGYYTGRVTGQINAATSRAIERFQIAQDDVHTSTLTLKTARNLGLVAVPRDTL